MPPTKKKPPLELQIWEPHPFLKRFRVMARPLAFRLTGPVVLALFLLLAAIDGNVTQASLKQVLCQDVRSYVNAGDHLCRDYAFSHEMSALRDVCALILVFIFPLTIPLMFRQWEGITNFLSAMDSRHILRISDRKRVENEVDRANAYFRRLAAWNPAVVLGALLCIMLVVRAQTAGNVYPILEVAPSSFGINPSHWWLSFRGTGTAGGLYFLLGFVVVYIILLQNIHGSRVVFLLWRIRHLVDYEADRENSDEYYGWPEVREILFATWSLTIIHGICFGMVGLSLPNGHALALVPLFIQWLVVTPFYMVIPGWQTRRNITAWKNRERVRLRGTLGPNADAAQRRAVENQIIQLKRIRVNPYAGLARRIIYYVGIIATIVFVIQVIEKIYN